MKHLQSGPIKDFAVGIYDGPHATPQDADDGPVFLGIKNVTPDGMLDLSDVKHISEQDFPKWTRRVNPQKDDIVFSYEATLHRYALIPEDFRGCLGRRMALIRPNTDRIDPRFLHYYLLAPTWRKVIESNIVSGATVDRIPIKKLPDFRIQVPSLPEQQKVSQILSAYDDLISNNHRRIELLEQTARHIYQEWFVRLRFPGYEHTLITDGMPESWDKRKFEDVLKEYIGGGWGQDDPTGSETTPAYVIRGTDFDSVTTGNFDAIGLRYHKDSALASRLLTPGDIVFEVSGGSADQLIGRSLFISEKMINLFDGAVICASFCKRFVPTSLDFSRYLYYHLRHIRNNGELSTFIKQSASALQNFNFAAFLEHHLVPVPDKPLLAQFAEQVEPIQSEMLILAMQIANLKRARDLLLPRLMSGEISV